MMTKKILITLFVCLAAGFGLQAQNRTIRNVKTPGKKALLIENQALKNSLDSLQAICDSLMSIQEEETEISAVLEGNETTMEYSAEMTDSLLHLWYQNSYGNDFFDSVHAYDMDSVKFTSNVSDEEMIRRLENMNSFISLPFNDNVKNYIILYSEKMPSVMGRALGLSKYYFPIFEEVLDNYGLPVELKYMAVIESMLNPVATSRAGAKGIWQFMYRTARGYGLEINSFVDERMDVEKAMDAAARYLQDAYKIFGDWTLAISSYNCGAGNVSKAIRRAGKSDFWSIYPYLPRETRGYVPAFVAAMYAMTYWKECGLVPAEVGMPAQTDTFEIKKNLHFEQITALTGIPSQDLENLNPQYVHKIIPGSEKTYILKLPFTLSSRFMEADLDSMYRYKADSLLSAQVLKDKGRSGSGSGSTGGNRVIYKVKSGDYLGRIASRYGVTVSQIKNWNHLRSNNLRIGQTLYLYPRGGAPKTSTASSSTAKSSSTATTKSSAGSSGGNTVYTVRSGDSLYTIAKRYPGVSAENIKQYNGLSSDKIKAGQKLKIPKP